MLASAPRVPVDLFDHDGVAVAHESIRLAPPGEWSRMVSWRAIETTTIDPA
jgi:hypothetical protein